MEGDPRQLVEQILGNLEVKKVIGHCDDDGLEFVDLGDEQGEESKEHCCVLD